MTKYFIYYNVVSENIRKGGGSYFTVLFSVFYFILFCNLLGMVPYSFTVTSHIVITLGLASTIFIGINYVGIRIHGLHMLSLFLPPGAPLALAPLLVFIELVSYSFRVISCNFCNNWFRVRNRFFTSICIYSTAMRLS